MAEPEPFGEVLYAGAESVGIPGQRRFRLKLMAESGRTASLWLEKEQLSALGDAIDTVLKGEGHEYLAAAGGPGEEPVFPLSCDIDYRVGQLSMGLYREERTIIVNSVPAQGGDDPEGPGHSFQLTYVDAERLRRQIMEVVAAGRPPCPLCSGPLDAGHICPRRNGHHKQA